MTVNVGFYPLLLYDIRMLSLQCLQEHRIVSTNTIQSINTMSNYSNLTIRSVFSFSSHKIKDLLRDLTSSQAI